MNSMNDYSKRALEAHAEMGGKIEVHPKRALNSIDDWSIVYTLVFPGIFRGALDAGVSAITDDMKVSAAHTLAGLVEEPTLEMIVPKVTDERVVPAIAGVIK